MRRARPPPRGSTERGTAGLVTMHMGRVTDLDSGIRTVAKRIRPDTCITVLTGAGVSAASGVPTFRGIDGLWKSWRPEDLATPDAFARHPRLVWEWYDWRRQRIAQCQPNRAHQVLAAWSQRYRRFVLITQNVDGLHERAGTEHTLRLHGSIWHVRCWQRCPSSPSEWRDETVPLREIPPQCPHCGGLIRPAVVWFGESIDHAVMGRSLAALDCDVFLTVGTSAIVHPAAGFIDEARRRGAFTAEVNLEATPASDRVDLCLPGAAEEILDRVEAILTERR